MVKNSACLVYGRSDIEFVSVPTLSTPGHHEAHFFRYAWRLGEETIRLKLTRGLTLLCSNLNVR